MVSRRVFDVSVEWRLEKTILASTLYLAASSLLVVSFETRPKATQEDQRLMDLDSVAWLYSLLRTPVSLPSSAGTSEPLFASRT
jgi:hypothetical protein